MSRVNALWKGFFAGGFTTALAILCHQDYLGKERFLALVQDNWVDLPWWPWALLYLLCAVQMYRIQRKLRKQDNAG